MENGKGDKRRPSFTPKEKMEENWKRIFEGDRTTSIEPGEITVREDRLTPKKKD